MKELEFFEREEDVDATTEERFFYQVEKLINYRKLGWPPEFQKDDAFKIADLAQELFVEWLRRESSEEDGFDSAAYIVLPYISYRLLNPGIRVGMRLDRCSPKKMEELIDLLGEELGVNPKDKIYRAVTRSSIDLFLQCLGELYLRREQ